MDLQRIKPFRICGNIYFVGTKPASSHLIVTEDGLIVLDSGYPQTLHHLVESIWELGFDVRDIRIILHSHGHYDHLGATKALLEIAPQAETYIGEADVEFANGKLDLTWARELGYEYREAFEPDHALHDGETIRLGSTEILCLSTPGHTPGVMSYFFNVTENGKSYRAGMHGGVGMNSMQRAFLDKYGLSLECRQQFLAGLERLKSEHVDVPLGNHVGMNDTLGKAARIAPGAPNPFIAPGEWLSFLEQCRQKMLEVIAKDI